MRRLLLFGLASVLAACSRPAADNLLLVSVDTLRADHLGAYGYSKPTSPNIDALAGRGALFERAYTHVPSTLPAHASMFTGKLPPLHGVRCNGKFRLAAGYDTLAELLDRRGFATGAVLGAFPLEQRFGLAQGFGLYDDDFASSATTARRRRGRTDDPGFWIGHDFLDFERGADEVTDRAIAWLKDRSGRWFLFVHYFDPHWPYEPPAATASRFELPYDGEVAYADAQLGRLLEAVRALPGRTLVVFTSDHGEGLGDHGEALHNRYLYDSTLHVPLVFELPGVIRAGARSDAVVGHVDLLPTVAALLSVDVPGTADGRSLLPLWGDAPVASARPHYAETLVWSLERPLGVEVRALVRGRHKLIESGGAAYSAVVTELYDRSADPAESEDRAMREPETSAELSRELRLWSSRLEGAAVEPQSIDLDEGARERLRSLGYL